MWIEPILVPHNGRRDWNELEEEEDKPFFILEHYDPVITEEDELLEENEIPINKDIRFCYRILLKMEDCLCIFLFFFICAYRILCTGIRHVIVHNRSDQKISYRFGYHRSFQKSPLDTRTFYLDGTKFTDPNKTKVQIITRKMEVNSLQSQN